MTTLATIFSVVAGISLCEFFELSLGSVWYARKANRALACLRRFKLAKTDGERQELILIAGMQTLFASSIALLFLAAMLGLALLPIYLLSLSPHQVIYVFAVESAMALVWWLLRRHTCSRK